MGERDDEIVVDGGCFGSGVRKLKVEVRRDGVVAAGLRNGGKVVR